MRLQEAQRLWRAETLYLNTASYGLPPDPGWDAFQAVLADWHGGRTSWEQWGDATEHARALFAQMVGVPVEWIATVAMREELARVLDYPKLAARIPDAAAILRAFDGHVRVVDPAPKAPVTCGDPADQKFIDLAVAHRCLLLSKDFEVLRMKKRLAALSVQAIASWRPTTAGQPG